MDIWGVAWRKQYRFELFVDSCELVVSSATQVHTTNSRKHFGIRSNPSIMSHFVVLSFKHGTGNVHVKCNFCAKEFKTPKSRLKDHRTSTPNFGIDPQKIPQEVIRIRFSSNKSAHLAKTKGEFQEKRSSRVGLWRKKQIQSLLLWNWSCLLPFPFFFLVISQIESKKTFDFPQIQNIPRTAIRPNPVRVRILYVVLIRRMPYGKT